MAPGLGQSLIPTPAVVGHRGASGERPEHTLEAYRLAIRQGADDIELDLVITADGVLVARHDATLFDTTDVADRPEFAGRRKTKKVQGSELTDWFVEDFTFDELRTLTARERFRKIRKGNTDFHDRLRVPSLDEVLTMVALESRRAGRTVGVMLELKHPRYFARQGLSLAEPLLAALQQHGLDHPRSRVTVMSFDANVLKKIAGRTEVGIIQLIDKKGTSNDPATWPALCTPEGLEAVEEYADGIGVHRQLIIPRDESGRSIAATSLVADAHQRLLTVHVWTLRAENRFLPLELRSGGRPGRHGNLGAEARLFLEAGVDGLITDHPDVVLAARAQHLKALRVG
jgi:glycerophosphoryl diester phosphodiesterase